MLDLSFRPHIAQAVLDRFPHYRAVSVVVNGYTPTSKLAAPTVQCAQWCEAHIEAWREAYRSFGASPKRTSSSLESLFRRYNKDDFVRWLQGKEARALHPIERASRAHHEFVSIHPFIDGNGRTGRFLLNLLLLRAGYPPAIIEQVNRQQYYRVLAEADSGNFRGLINLIARACERSLRLYVEATKTVKRAPARGDHWIPLAEAAMDTPYSQEYLSLLARTGKLRAKKQGRNWLTTRNAISDYMATRRQ